MRSGLPSSARTVLAGVLCGCAAWTKNEGLVLAVALPAIGVLLMFVPPNDVVSGVLAPGALRYWADTVRVQFVLREMGGGLLAWGGWPVPSSATLATDVSRVSFFLWCFRSS